MEVMAGEEGKVSGIEKFDGTDFGVLEDADWRLSLWEEIASTFFGDETWTMKDEDWNLLDRQVLGVIQLTLSRSIAYNVVKENTSGFDKVFV